MIITEYEAKFIDLSRYVPSLVEDPREVRRFVDGLEHRYRGLVVRDVRHGTYSDVVDTALRYESYLEMDKVECESKKSRNTDLLSQNQWCSLLVVFQLDRASSRCRGRVAAPISQVIIRGVLTVVEITMVVALGQMGLVLLVVKRGILLNTVLKEILVLVELLHNRRELLQLHRVRFAPARAAPQGARGQGQQGAQGGGGPSRFFAMTRQDVEASNAVVTDTVVENEASN
ncbi:uncharacterized protein LOC132032211 [Lycium ferocissimum]|uniref:uncharacterized protein LOC132032211 n=1 Tax=Lycium ferocissimum TaxID=112874 RepID=UPI00281627CD|nr:uncharacterized protein LOC132032211 [Lycium ferocissimum]